MMNRITGIRIRILSGLAWLALAATAAADEVPEKPAVGVSKIESNLRAGVAKVDITPPPGTKVVGHVRETHGVRDPILAAILLLDDGKTKAAIVTLDLIAAGMSWCGRSASRVEGDRDARGEHPGRGLAQPLRPGLVERTRTGAGR